jgi:hypothetical protein
MLSSNEKALAKTIWKKPHTIASKRSVLGGWHSKVAGRIFTKRSSSFPNSTEKLPKISSAVLPSSGTLNCGDGIRIEQPDAAPQQPRGSSRSRRVDLEPANKIRHYTPTLF